MDAAYYIQTILGTLLPSGLTCISCLWLFFKFFFEKRKTIAFSLIFILALSDFIFSLTGIISHFFPLTILSQTYRIALFLTSHFSIFWVSAISFVVYKSLKERDLNSKALVMKSVIGIFTISVIFALW